MLKIRRVLLSTDFSECSAQALRYALLFAETHDAELHMLHAVVLHGDDPHNPANRFPDRERVFEELHETVESVLADTAAEHEAHEIGIERVTRRAVSVLPAVLDYAEECQADLIVCGTHGRGILGRLVLGSVVREIVRLAPCPVLTVRQREPAPTLHRVDRIIAPVDFSAHSALAVDYGRALAEELDAKLEIVHVLEESAYPECYYPVVTPPPASTGTTLRKVEDSLREWLAEQGDSGDTTVRVLAGRAAVEIAGVSEDGDSNLIVIATHGRTGFQRVLMGSVAEGVVQHARCPVMTVKPFGENLCRDKQDQMPPAS
jgi:nucleotide-binding universal stress UspA family protein